MSEQPQDPKPVQLDRAWVQAASPERIEEARQAGQLNDLLGITSEDGAA